jgi:transcriptional regulator with XRE-family HTH domain
LSSSSEQPPHKQLPKANLRPIVARWLKAALGENPNLSAIAESTGVSRGTIYAILKEETDVKDETISKLATALGVAPPGTAAETTWGPLLDVLQRLPKDVQREIAVRAVRQGIEAQELQGPSLLRAMVSLCKALDELGYPAMAREIRSELLKAMTDDLEKRGT